MLSPTNQEEINLNSLTYALQQESDAVVQYQLASTIALNGSNNMLPSFRNTYALEIMTLHFQWLHARGLDANVTLWRAWFIWWTRHEQLHFGIDPIKPSVVGPLKMLLTCAQANAWNKAWHWALLDNATDAVKYEKEAKVFLKEAHHALRHEKHPLRTLLSIALKEESWYNIEKEQVNI